jgi:rRNA maturation protein Nop10
MEDEERILAYARARIANGNGWIRYLENIRADGVNDPSGLFTLARRLPSHRGLSEFSRITVEAHDLLVPLFDDEHHPRVFEEVKRDINQAKKLLHQKYPLPTDKCPKCGGPGIVRFTGYPMPALNAAERLGYAGSSGCIGSSTNESRMCRACGARWTSLVPYELTIFDYLEKRFQPRRVEPSVPNESLVDFSRMEPIGQCPQCGDKVYEVEMAYVCRRSVGADSSCRFRAGKMILQQAISAEDMRQLLTEGRTRFLKGFVSNRARRRFTASLALSPEGKVGFEFDEKTKALIAKAKQKTNEASGRRS